MKPVTFQNARNKHKISITNFIVEYNLSELLFDSILFPLRFARFRRRYDNLFRHEVKI
jgi:hypothetical protein